MFNLSVSPGCKYVSPRANWGQTSWCCCHANLQSGLRVFVSFACFCMKPGYVRKRAFRQVCGPEHAHTPVHAVRVNTCTRASDTCNTSYTCVCVTRWAALRLMDILFLSNSPFTVLGSAPSRSAVTWTVLGVGVKAALSITVSRPASAWVCQPPGLCKLRKITQKWGKFQSFSTL